MDLGKKKYRTYLKIPPLLLQERKGRIVKFIKSVEISSKPECSKTRILKKSYCGNLLYLSIEVALLYRFQGIASLWSILSLT